jgi:hypothetical protein
MVTTRLPRLTHRKAAFNDSPRPVTARAIDQSGPSSRSKQVLDDPDHVALAMASHGRARAPMTTAVLF